MSENKLFLDTCGWLSLLNAGDRLHAAAARVWRDCGRKPYTIFVTDWVVAETGNGLARSRVKSAFVQAFADMKISPQVRVIYATPEKIDRALGLYQQRTDKDWGLVDCLSFLIMQDHQIVEAFTNDRHFEQAGFRCLLPQPN